MSAQARSAATVKDVGGRGRDAHLRMQSVTLEAFNTHVINETALASVLEGVALKNIRAQIKWWIDNKLWTVGRAVRNVVSVRAQRLHRHPAGLLTVRLTSAATRDAQGTLSGDAERAVRRRRGC